MVYMVHRSDIERDARIAKLLTDAFDRFCAATPATK